MQLTNQVIATKEQIQNLMNYPADKPVVMLNILRFKAKTGNGKESGVEAYMRYGKNVFPLLTGVGGKIIYQGEIAQTIIGDAQNQPHLILLVEYPSVQHFIKMVTSEAYQKIKHDREIALEFGGLMATMPSASNHK